MRTIGLLSVFLLPLLLAWRLADLHQSDLHGLARSDHPDEVQRLFESLRDQGLMSLDGHGRIQIAPADAVLARQVAGERGEQQALQQRLLDTYYHALPGAALRQWLTLWNRGRLLGAVRDDRPTPVAGGGWQVSDDWGEALASHPRVPLAFGYLLDGEIRPGFHDWQAVRPAEAGGWLTYTSRVALSQPRTLHIDLIGLPDNSQLPRHRLYACRPEPFADGRHCRRADPSPDYAAWRIELPLSTGVHELRLPLRPAANPQQQDQDLPLALVEGEPVWRPDRARYAGVAAGSARAPSRFVLEMADGAALTDEAGSGAPTPLVEELGLSGLVGQGPDHRQSLSGLLARSAIADQGRVTLTLESGLQRIADQELARQLQEAERRGGGLHALRRGAVVVLDVASGAILAAAGRPLPPPDSHRWDRRAFAANWPQRDPFRFVPWQGLDSHSAPGSTFKPVTAMAAMDAIAEGEAGLAGMLEGWPQGQLQAETGLDPQSARYRAAGATEVPNFGDAPLARAYQKKLPTTPCGTTRQSQTLGLREAVRDSINTWFVRLAERMDGGRLATGGPDTHLYRRAGQLGFGPPFALFPAIGGLPRDDLSHWSARGSVLKAHSGSLTLGDGEAGVPGQRLAQNAFGQGVQASALQMARVAAAVASGRLPHPTLLLAWEGEPLSPPPARELGLDERWLALLREGMKAVPETGTAQSAFVGDEHRCVTWGKTGTAETEFHAAGGQVRSLRSVWFIGWQRETGGRELAFACSLTHLAPGNYGGSWCGPLMQRILARWRQEAGHGE
jgi:cell division protein FtsI/penicillin-binding protein 2